MGVNPKVGSDGLRIYHSGVSSDGGAAKTQSEALGGYRSTTRISTLGFLYTGTLAGVTVDHVSGTNGIGLGVLQAVDANRLTWRAPSSSTAGTPVTFANGDQRPVFDGTNTAKFVLVSRVSANDLAGTASVKCLRQYNNAFAMGDVPVTAVGGEDYYRGLFVRNELDYPVTPSVYRATLGTTVITAVGSGLPASGAGTITCDPAFGTFADWPRIGWARIKPAIGAVRETVYYSSRTDTVLTVPATGRARLGTTAAAGVDYDYLYSLPGLRIASETPSSKLGGYIQTIATENVEPSGRSWQTPISYAGGLSLGELQPGEHMGLWIHREIPEAFEPSAQMHSWLYIGAYFAD